MAIGGTPKGEHAFHGRIYQLMITRHVYDRRQIFDVYQGQKRALSTVRKNSGLLDRFWRVVKCLLENKGRVQDPLETDSA